MNNTGFKKHNRLSRRSQISGQIIMYIFSAIVVAAVIGYGVSQIMNLNQNVGNIQCLDFQKKLEYLLVKNRAYGSVYNQPIPVSCSLSKVCFITLRESYDGYGQPWEGFDEDLYPIIYDSWESGVQRNVFFIGETGEITHLFYVKGIRADSSGTDDDYDSAACFDVGSGYINPILRGKGKYLQVEKQDADY